MSEPLIVELHPDSRLARRIIGDEPVSLQVDCNGDRTWRIESWELSKDSTGKKTLRVWFIEACPV